MDAGVAATYDRVAVPHFFAAVARDLVNLVEVPVRGRILDVGAGTGAATIPSTEAAGQAGFVVALDPSLEMLGVLRDKCRAVVVSGEVPGLPFPEASFDVVTANFVLSHVKDYDSALADMMRVLKPGGSLGVTAWAPSSSGASLLWKSVATRFVREEVLTKGFRELVPWEERFSDPAHLHQALAGAQTQKIHVAQREYRISLSVGDFLTMREVSVEGKLLAEELSDEARAELKKSMNDAFLSRFQDGVAYTREAYIAHGTKPTR